jgi:hypothetical protein
MVGFENWKLAYGVFLGSMVSMGIGTYFLIKRLEKYWK